MKYLFTILTLCASLLSSFNGYTAEKSNLNLESIAKNIIENEIEKELKQEQKKWQKLW